MVRVECGTRTLRIQLLRTSSHNAPRWVCIDRAAAAGCCSQTLNEFSRQYQQATEANAKLNEKAAAAAKKVAAAAAAAAK